MMKKEAMNISDACQRTVLMFIFIHGIMLQQLCLFGQSTVSIYAIYDMGQDRVGDCICLHASSSNNGNGPGDN